MANDTIETVDGIRKKYSRDSDGAYSEYVDFSAFEAVGSHTSINLSGTVTTLTPPDGATKLMIQPISNNIRVTIDGVNPTTSLGFQIAAGSTPTLIGISPKTIIKVISETGTSVLQYLFGS